MTPADTAGPPGGPSGAPDPGAGPTPRRGRASRRTKLAAAAAVLLLVAAADLSRPPEQQLSARFLLGAIDAYQATLSPRLGRFGVACRFTPSCSRYAEGAIRQDGALVGSLRSVARVLRCGPWTPPGTHDPP